MQLSKKAGDRLAVDLFYRVPVKMSLEYLGRALDKSLTLRQMRVMELYYGFGELPEPISQTRIGTSLCVTPARVSQIKLKSLRLLRYYVKLNPPESFEKAGLLLRIKKLMTERHKTDSLLHEMWMKLIELEISNTEKE